MCVRARESVCVCALVSLFHFRPFTTYKNHILKKKIQWTCTQNMLPVPSWSKPVCRWGPTCQYNSWGEDAIMRHPLHLSPLPITSIYLLHSSPESLSIKSLRTVDDVLWELCPLTEKIKDWMVPVHLDLPMVCSGYLVRQYLATKWISSVIE